MNTKQVEKAYHDLQENYLDLDNPLKQLRMTEKEKKKSILMSNKVSIHDYLKNPADRYDQLILQEDLRH